MVTLLICKAVLVSLEDTLLRSLALPSLQGRAGEVFTHRCMVTFAITNAACIVICEIICRIAGESVVDADLVGWVMVGVQHLPRSEDVPVISNWGTGRLLLQTQVSHAGMLFSSKRL